MDPLSTLYEGLPIMQENLAPICVFGLIFICYLGNDLGDAKLGNNQEPYTATPQVCEVVDSKLVCKPVQQ
jgi:hypothetical protein